MFDPIIKAMAFGFGDISLTEKYNLLKSFYKIITEDYVPMCARTFLDSPELMKIIREKPKFNAVVTLWKCGVFLSHVLDTPLIWFTPTAPEAFPHQLESLGGRFNPNIQPTTMGSFVEPMSFFDRIMNSIVSRAARTYLNYIEEDSLNMVRDLLDKDLRNYTLDNIDLISRERAVYMISNSHIATHGTWPYHGNVENIGGVHCRPGKPLPSDLKKYMDLHPEGVVYVSFGSMFKATGMTYQQKQVFYDTFEELNTPIIWKWDDDDVSDIPKNVRVSKWLPQNDLLAHPNLKVFVTHGGLLSLQEALYHKTTLVGIPLGADQASNIARAESNGFAILLDLKTLTKDKLTEAIRRASTDINMRNAIERMNLLFTSGESPLERGVKVIERVLRDPTTLHLMKPEAIMNMPNYQYHGIDIVLFILSIMSAFCIIALKLCFCCLRRRTTPIKPKTE